MKFFPQNKLLSKDPALLGLKQEPTETTEQSGKKTYFEKKVLSEKKYINVKILTKQNIPVKPLLEGEYISIYMTE